MRNKDHAEEKSTDGWRNRNPHIAIPANRRRAEKGAAVAGDAGIDKECEQQACQAKLK